MARLEREAEQRERQRQLAEHKAIQQKVAKERLEQLKSTPLGSKVFSQLDESVSQMSHLFCNPSLSRLH